MNEKKKVVVLGASEHTWRYSNIAVRRLHEQAHQVIAIGRTNGRIGLVAISTEYPMDADLDTVTIYLNPTHLSQYKDQIIRSSPERVIFNPGAEDPVFAEELREQGIEVLEACTLVMLSTGQF